MGLLSQIPLFASLSSEERALVEHHAIPRSIPKNTLVVAEGDLTDSLYIIVSGGAKVYCSDNEGKEVILRDLHDGDYFGDLALLLESQRSASVVTTKPCRMLVIQKEAFRNVITGNPEIAYRLLVHLAERIRDLTGNVKNLALEDVYGRVRNTLESLAKDVDGVLKTELPLTQQDIANRVGASREMVARIMKDLETGGYIKIEKKYVILLKDLPTRY